MRGSIIPRGKNNSWRLKFDAGVDDTGNRKTQYVTFRGTKKEARVRLTELVNSVNKGEFVEQTKTTVGEFVSARIGQWEAAGDITVRTAARYRELYENQIAPYLGAKVLQKLKPLDIERWHTNLRTSGRADGKCGLAARTIGHAHRVLSSALSDAVENELVVKNVVKTKAVPKSPDKEMVIVKDVPGLVAKLDQGGRIIVPATVALFTGMRLGEVLALRWASVDLDKGIIRVREALEETDGCIRFKTPKSKAGRRDITLPDILVEALRNHRKAQLELRMKLGVGKLPDDALLFATIDGAPAVDHIHEQGMGKVCRQHRHARGDVPCATPHPRKPTDRCGDRYRHHQQAPWSRQAGHHAADLRACVSEGRQQSSGGYQQGHGRGVIDANH
jgi:integrase